MKFVGLDLSARQSGLAVIDDTGAFLEGSTSGYDLEKGATTREKIERLINISLDVEEFIRKWSPVGVAIEGLAYGSKSLGTLAELSGVVKVRVWSMFGLEPFIVPPFKARKTVFGKSGTKGVKPKDFVRKSLSTYPLVGSTISNHNMADAYVVAEALRLEWKLP